MRQPQEPKPVSYSLKSFPWLCSSLCPPASSDIHQALAEWDNLLTQTKINSSPPGLVSCFTERPNKHYHQSKMGAESKQVAEGKELKLYRTKIIYNNICYRL